MTHDLNFNRVGFEINGRLSHLLKTCVLRSDIMTQISLSNPG